MFKKALIALGLAASMTAPSMALVLDGSGNVTDWGFAPQLGSTTNNANVTSGNQVYTQANNYAPIAYPGGVGHAPSGGEPWDLEEMHVRLNGGVLQVLTVTSSPATFTSDGNPFYLGDLFLTIAGQKFGIVTKSANGGLAAGSIYKINSNSDLVALHNDPHSYFSYGGTYANDYGPADTVTNIAGPWAVAGTISSGQLLGTATINTAVANYGGSENGTNLFEYNIAAPSSLLALFQAGNTFTAHQTYSCGNDVIQVTGVVPEPASIALVTLGASMILFRRRRNENREEVKA